MLRLTTLRGVIVAVAALALVAGCSATSKTTAGPGADLFAPTGAPVTLTQIHGATGNQMPLGDGLSLVVPEGSKPENAASKPAGYDVTVYRMPDANAVGFPAVKVSWGVDKTTGVVEDSWTHEVRMTRDKTVSNYVRSSATWPGARVAVVATWTQEVPAATGTVVTDVLALWVQTPSGTVALLLAVAPKGQLDGSTALDALRSLTVG